jgi:hypothetical protein
MNDLDAGVRKDLLRRLGKEKQADVTGLQEFLPTLDDGNLPANVGEWQLCGGCIKTTLEVAQIRPNLLRV